FRGLRKVEVARALGLTPAVVSQYEQGRTRPSAATLAALSLQLGFPPEFFERGRQAVRIDQGQTHFRRLRSTSKLDRDRLVVRLELLAELLGRIEEHVRLPAVSTPVWWWIPRTGTRPQKRRLRRCGEPGNWAVVRSTMSCSSSRPRVWYWC